MTTRTTSRLRITPYDRALLWLRWHRANLTTGALFALSLALIAVLLRAPASAPPVTAQPTPALILVYPTARPTPPAPTPDMALRQEVELLRARVVELESRPAPAPQVVYVEAVATPEPELYQVANEPPPLAPQQLVLLDRGAWAQQAQEHREAK